MNLRRKYQNAPVNGFYTERRSTIRDGYESLVPTTKAGSDEKRRCIRQRLVYDAALLELRSCSECGRAPGACDCPMSVREAQK